LPISRIQPG